MFEPPVSILGKKGNRIPFDQQLHVSHILPDWCGRHAGYLSRLVVQAAVFTVLVGHVNRRCVCRRMHAARMMAHWCSRLDHR